LGGGGLQTGRPDSGRPWTPFARVSVVTLGPRPFEDTANSAAAHFDYCYYSHSAANWDYSAESSWDYYYLPSLLRSLYRSGCYSEQMSVDFPSLAADLDYSPDCPVGGAVAVRVCR